MEVSPISALLVACRSTPAIRAIWLSLPLLMFRVYADDPHHAFAMDHLAFVANLLNGRSNFHKNQNPFSTQRRRDAEISAERTHINVFSALPPRLSVSASNPCSIRDP